MRAAAALLAACLLTEPLSPYARRRNSPRSGGGGGSSAPPRQPRGGEPPAAEGVLGHRCCDVERHDIRSLSPAAFAELEKAQRPFILTHALDHWPASRWSIAAVQRKFGSTKLNFTVQGLELEMPVGTRPSSQVHPRLTVASGHELRLRPDR